MKPQTKREYLRELVADKNQWARPLTEEEKALGFLGWHERGYLPHCDYPGLVQFVTFRLADSMPDSRRGEWEHLLGIENLREKRAKLEEYLDRGMGSCQVRVPEIAQIAEDALLHFHNDRYELLAWCVMPNHVHVLVHVWHWPLWKMIAAWKKFSGAKALAHLGAEHRPPDRQVGIDRNSPIRRSALQFWQREYWDTFMRNEAQEKKAISYIENNPVKAKLCKCRKNGHFRARDFAMNFTGSI